LEPLATYLATVTTRFIEKRSEQFSPSPSVVAALQDLFSRLTIEQQEWVGENILGPFAPKSSKSQSEDQLIVAFIGGAAILSIVILLAFFLGKSTDASKPQAAADSTGVFTPLQGANKLNPSHSDIMAAQNRLIELGFLAGPADGVWGTKSRAALRAFKIANGLAGDDKWDALAIRRLYSTQAARSPLPPATTGR